VLLQYTELHNGDSELPFYGCNVEEYAHLMTQNLLYLTLRRIPALTAIRDFSLSNINECTTYGLLLLLLLLVVVVVVVVVFINLLLLFGRRRNCLKSGRS